MPYLRLLFMLLAAATPLFAQTPEWIWHDNKGASPTNNETRYFRKVFVLDQMPQRAVLTVAADDQGAGWVNGKQVVSSPAWQQPESAQVAALLKPGTNVLGGRGRNNGGDAAFIARLELTYGDSKKNNIVTDTSWRSSASEEKGWVEANFSDSAWTAAVSKGRLGVAPWGDIMVSKQATAASTLEVLPGFKVELLHSALQDEGSWIAMTADNKGRLIVSPQEGGLLRISVQGSETKVERLSTKLGSAMGLLYAFDSLYVNGRGPEGTGIYRMRDTNGDDTYDHVAFLKKIDGATGEHGTHGLVLGLDNYIYVMNGNFVKVPSDLASTSPHRNYAEDQLLPRANDGNGFGNGYGPPGGFILKADKDFNSWEMWAAGLRNTYDFAVNQDGEFFGFDSDMEWDWGTPWYRATRINHFVSGGDYGYREGTGKWPNYYPDSLPTTLDIGIGSPTGVEFGTGAKFPEKYQKALYAMDWSYGRIFAVHLTPQGATYSATPEVFVKGKPLNVTDLVIGKDGAMYFITGGRRTQSGLYRITYTGNEPVTLVKGENKQGEDARNIRQMLESFHGKKNPAAVSAIWPRLNSEDRWIRYAARVALESQDVQEWQSRALQESQPRAALSALLALARVGPKETQADLLKTLSKFPMDKLPEDLKLEKLRLIQLSFIRQGRPESELAALAVDKLDRLYPSNSEALNRELAIILIYLQAPGVIEKTLDLVDRAKTQEEALHYIFHLRNLKNGWSLDQRKRYFSWFNKNRADMGHPPELIKWFEEAGRQYGNGASFEKFIINMKKEAESTLNADEKLQLASLIAGPQVVKVPEAKPRSFVKEWKMEELLPSLNEVAKNRNFARGRQAYLDAQCMACHKFRDAGGANGPDLTAIASRFTRRDLLESILEPSKVLSEQYQNTTYKLKDGEDVTGRAIEEKDGKLTILVNPLADTKVQIAKKDLASQTPSKFSPMPEGLANGLTKEEILDLIAYMESGGQRNHAFFRK